MVFFFEPETIRRTFFRKKPIVQLQKNLPNLTPSCLVLVGIFGLYFALQIYLPLRNHLYKGDVFYTEEGHRLSWRMMLRYKSGYTNYMIRDLSTDSTWTVKPIEFLTPKQSSSLSGHPDMIWQFAQYLEREYQEKGIEDVEIKVEAFVRLNRDPMVRLIDPEVDLSEVRWQHLKHSPWILSPNN